MSVYREGREGDGRARGTLTLQRTVTSLAMALLTSPEHERRLSSVRCGCSSRWRPALVNL